MSGAYPAGQDDGETDRILTTLLELGVTTFVCLQAEFSLHTSENLWRTGQVLGGRFGGMLLKACGAVHKIYKNSMDSSDTPCIL